MQFKTTFRILGVLLMIFSLSMLPPALMSVWYQDDTPMPFLIAFGLTLLTGFFLWLSFRDANKELKTRDGFIITVLFWIVLSAYGALPFMIADAPHETFTDAMFEAVSGLTTTGASVTLGVDYLPHAIRFYRQELQFLGGMGIIVLAVAILPMLGIGGMQLYRTEMPGPIKDSKLTPRITETAKALWYIYLGLTIACIFCYWIAGMTLFDAVGEAFSTVATGGFTMHDSSFEFYNSPVINLIGIVFMILAATNFSLHFISLQNFRLGHYWRDLEFRAFIFLLLTGIVITTWVLSSHHFYGSFSETFIKSAFNVVSLATTTGLVASPFANWPTLLPVFILLLAIIGGCGGSTCGGMKVLRVVLLNKQGFREIYRLIHPRAIFPIKFGRHALPDHVLQSVWGFIAIFIGLFIVILLAMMATGLDLTTAFGASVASLANAGQGIGEGTGNFVAFNTASKWIFIFGMLAGRLEIFTVLVLLTPAFWRN